MTSVRNMTTHLSSRRAAAAVLAAFLALAAHVPGETAPGVKEFDRSTAELAASLLLTKLQDDVLAAPPGPALLEAEMDVDPGKYTEPDDAKRKLQRHYRDALAGHYRQEAEKYLDRIAGAVDRETAFGFSAPPSRCPRTGSTPSSTPATTPPSRRPASTPAPSRLPS